MCKKFTSLLWVSLGVLALTSAAAWAVSYDVRIATAMDDIEEYVATGGMSGTSTDLEMPYEDSISASQDQIVGLRWAVPVGKGTMITKAYVEFTFDEPEVTGEVHLIVEGQLAPNAAAFTTTAYDLSSRTRTKAQVKWAPEEWAVNGATAHNSSVELKYKTPDLAPIIQEIINQPGWAAGNALVLLIRDDKSNPSKASRVAAAYEDIASNGFHADTPALLHVEVSNAPAGAPSPADGATDVPRDSIPSWTAGQYAATHNVYFGTDLANLSSVSQGQTPTQYVPAGGLAYGQTYYWRVDEVNASPSSAITPGTVWSFTVEPYSYPIPGKSITATASSAQPGMGPEKTIDGSGLTGDQHSNDPMTMWLSTGVLPNWIQYQFDAVYKLDKLMVWNSNQQIEPYLGFGARDVTVEDSVDGTTWTAPAGVPPFAQAPGAPTAATTTVSFAGVSAKYVKLTINKTYGGMPTAGLSEVRFLSVPLQARGPQPADAATGVAADASLSWRPGREAGSHQVFLGTNQAAVTGGTATATTVTEHSFTPAGLAFGTTYYWRVDEVNTVTTPGAVWSFTTEPYAVVDDFESYNDDNNRIYDTWIDGLADGKSGSQVGYNNAPFAEKTILHGGQQSLPFLYANTAAVKTSEATRTFAPAQDWTRGGAKTLVLYFYGDPGNSAGQMYVKINGTKVSYSGANTVQTAGWGQWNIDLAATGVSLKAVKTLTVGVEGSGTGKLLFDDLRLYANAPAVPVGAALDVKLVSVTDDMEEYVTDGAMQTTSTDLEMPYENSGTPPTQPQVIGLRYLLAQPKGAKISKAYVEFTCDETKGGTQPVNLIIQGQLIATAPAFLSTAKNISSRTPLTKAQVSWAVENWTTVGQKSQTADITPILQELVNQSGWASGNAIVLIISDDKSKPSTGVRCADAMEDQANGAGTAPVLHIEVLP